MIFKKLFCKHDYNWHGWSYCKCKKCDNTIYNPDLNRKIQTEWWKSRVIEGDPVWGREAINKLLMWRGIHV